MSYWGGRGCGAPECKELGSLPGRGCAPAATQACKCACRVARRLVYEVAQGQIGTHCPGVPLIYDTVDLHFLRESRDAITTLAEKQVGCI